MKTLNGTVAALVVLCKSTQPIKPQAVDRIVDPCLIKVGKLTKEVRGELAEAPHKFITVFCFRVDNQRTAPMLATSRRPARDAPHRQAQERQAKCRADGFMQVLTMPRWRQAA